MFSQPLQTSISTGNWTEEAKQELDNIVNQIENDTITYKRFPQEAAGGFHQGGRIHEAASLILRGSEEPSRKSATTVQQRYENDQKEQSVQEPIIEIWAKANNVWFENLDDAVKGMEQIGEGGEATVWYDGKGIVTKLLNTDYYISPQLALDRITLHNTFFSAAPLTLKGFGRDKDGKLIFVVEQPFVEGTHASEEEVNGFLSNMGFKKTKDNGHTYTNESIYLSDLHDQNILKTPQGNLVVIDVDARFNTPELGYEGTYQTDNSLEAMQTSSIEETLEPERNKVEETLDEYDKLNKQIDNLLSGEIIINGIKVDWIDTPLTASEVRHTAELVVNAISDMITSYQENPDLPFKQFSNLRTNLDFATASRKEIVQAVGIDNLIERAKTLFNPETNPYDIQNTDDIIKGFFICMNWEALITLAADVFVANEGFSISKDMSTGRFGITEAENVDYDNFNESEDLDDIAETEGDTQEHWQIESRTIDNLYSMSDLVRREINRCYLLDKNGNKVLSVWGIPERVNARDVTNSILHWTKGDLSLSAMIASLQAKQQNHTWLSQLLTRLTDTSGKETDFQSQFFGVFCKDFQKYSVVTKDNSGYSSINVNNKPALAEAIKIISAEIALKEHPLFTPKGLNSKLLGNKEDESGKVFTLHSALKEIRSVTDGYGHFGYVFTPEAAQVVTKNVMGVCRILGYPVTEDMVSEIVNDKSARTMRGELITIVDVLDKRRKYEEKNPNERGKYNPISFSDYGIATALRKFLTPITDSLEATAINSFYDSGKMYQSYVIPSFVTQLMDKLHGSSQERRNFMIENYGNSEWFAFKHPKNVYDEWDTGLDWRNPWLYRICERDGADVIDHKVELNFNKHNYMKDMSPEEYTLSLITEFFSSFFLGCYK